MNTLNGLLFCITIYSQFFYFTIFWVGSWIFNLMFSIFFIYIIESFINKFSFFINEIIGYERGSMIFYLNIILCSIFISSIRICPSITDSLPHSLTTKHLAFLKFSFIFLVGLSWFFAQLSFCGQIDLIL